MDRIKLFFSWASEHPNTKSFVLRVLDRLRDTISKDDIEVEIQESTSDTLGFVRIEEVILNRIEQCDFFVADLTPMGKTEKPTVNPNVCFELGYMIGRHWVERVYGICNEKYLKNPSLELPFDFSHNRVRRIKADGTEEEKEKRIDEYASEIREIILKLKSEGSLYSKHSLTEHDKKINERICTDMERFKDLVHGFEESLEIYNGRDTAYDYPGDYYFMRELLTFLGEETHKFADDSLNVYGKELTKAIGDFILFQAYHTHQYFLSSGNSRYCTKLYLIENHPEMCPQYRLPAVYDISDPEYQKELEPYITESNEYHEKAEKVIQCYKELEQRYVSLEK